MKICAIQPPYPYTLDQSEATIDFIISEMKACDKSIDLILTPEYSNAPSVFQKGECIPYAKEHTKYLIDTAMETAKRCNAIVAVNFVAEIDGKFRNTTRIFDRTGKIAGDFYKQHLPSNEICIKGLDNSYALEYVPPEIIEVDGIRFASLICYDCYFNEYIAHIAVKKPDVVLVSSHQRSERADILEMQCKSVAFTCNSYVVRSSVSMGENEPLGGYTAVASPDGKIIASFGQKTGSLICETGDVHFKYMRSDSFGGRLIRNDEFVENGRTPWSYRPCGSSVSLNDDMLPYPRVCAHRGFNTIAPENSMPAFGAAVALGADEIELDLWESKDGELIVCHDNCIDRISNDKGKICDLTYSQLMEIDVGEKYGEHFKGLRLCTFEEMLKVFSCKAIINLHIKSREEGEFSRDLFKRIVDLIYKYDCQKYIYLMTSPNVLAVALEMAPEIKRCCAAGKEPYKIVENAIKYQCYKVQLFKPYFNQEMIDRAHANGILCNVFWSDDRKEALKMLDMGIDTILTNDYLNIASAVKEYKNQVLS